MGFSLANECEFEKAKELLNEVKNEEIQDALKKQCNGLLETLEKYEPVINEGEKLTKKGEKQYYKVEIQRLIIRRKRIKQEEKRNYQEQWKIPHKKDEISRETRNKMIQLKEANDIKNCGEIVEIGVKGRK